MLEGNPFLFIHLLGLQDEVRQSLFEDVKLTNEVVYSQITFFFSEMFSSRIHATFGFLKGPSRKNLFVSASTGAAGAALKNSGHLARFSTPQGLLAASSTV